MIKAFAAFEPKGKLKPFEYDPGELKSQEVEIDVLYSGICHSDLSLVDDAWGMTQYPIVLPGHEVVGKIAKVGGKVKNLQLNQVVGLGWHAGYCNECALCLSGDNNLCATAQPTIVGHHGGFADKVRADANSVIPIPEGVELESAGPLFCGGITVFNPLVQFDIKPTDSVAVIGIGGLGHMALQFLNAWGCEVTAFTSSEGKKKEAIRLGAHHTLNSRSQDEVEGAAGRFDLIISTVNVKLDWNLYLNTLKPAGDYTLSARPWNRLISACFPLIMGQRSVSGSPVGSPSTITRMLEFASLHKIKPVIEKFSFDEINEAIARLRSGKTHYRIVLCR